jgi:predicted esterase YcpF (UPF0227 family)
MKILNIHGYGGSSRNCACSVLKELGFDVISPDMNYDNETPHDTIKKLCSIVRDENISMICGTSLGGFFASVLSAELDIPCILINPCLMPFLHLPRLGYKADVAPFISLFGKLDKIDKEKTSCIIGNDDEIIDTHDFTKNLLYNSRFCEVPGGMHSGATLPLKKYFSEVLDIVK